MRQEVSFLVLYYNSIEKLQSFKCQNVQNHHHYGSGHNGTLNGEPSSPSVYYGQSRRSSIHSNGEPPQEVSPAHVKFVRDTSRFWYKPTISREEGEWKLMTVRVHNVITALTRVMIFCLMNCLYNVILRAGDR